MVCAATSLFIHSMAVPFAIVISSGTKHALAQFGLSAPFGIIIHMIGTVAFAFCVNPTAQIDTDSKSTIIDSCRVFMLIFSLQYF